MCVLIGQLCVIIDLDQRSALQYERDRSYLQ